MAYFGPVGDRPAWGLPEHAADPPRPGPHLPVPLSPPSSYSPPAHPIFGLGGILDPSWWPSFITHHGRRGQTGDVLDYAAVTAAFAKQATEFGTEWERPALDFGKYNLSDNKLWEMKATLVLRHGKGLRKLNRLIVCPQDAPFQLVSPPASVTLSEENPRAPFSLCISPSKSRGECCCKLAYLVAELEFKTVDPSGSLWNTQSVAIGCQLTVEFTRDGNAALQVTSEPFVPIQFKKQFNLPPTVLHLHGDGGLDLDFIPSKFRPLLQQTQESDPLQILFEGPCRPHPVLVGVRHQTNASTYKDRLRYALQLEAYQMHRDMESHDMTSIKVDFVRTDQVGFVYAHVHVPGLREGRPAPSRSDIVRLRQRFLPGAEILARVHEQDTWRSQLLLRAPASALSILRDSKSRFHVRFTVGQHYYAIQSMVDAVTRASESLLSRLNCITFDRLPETDRPFVSIFQDLNAEQQVAVKRCVSPISQNEPVILINGPPGTGKTKTIASAVLQYLLTQSAGRVLAVAPSNSAADVLLRRLLELANANTHAKPLLKHKPFLRLNSYTRHVNEARGETLSCCIQDGELFSMPSRRQLQSARVIVSTCTTTSYLDKECLPHGFFDIIAFDEAAQALETETLVPLRLATSMTRIVFCGDPKQLGPQVRSSVAARLGLGTSMMERLHARRMGSSLNHFAINLSRNYRSHEALLSLPSRMFYNNRLIACADRARSSSLDSWPDLPRRGLPFWFWSIESSESTPDERAPSLVNLKEVDAVEDLCIRLTKSGYAEPADIGIIAPYRRQVIKIRERLRQVDHGNVNIGTVNDYQGQEQRIVIVTTTLTSRKSLSRETRTDCGLTGNPKKFNVAITRAEAMLVVVGCAKILDADPCWSQYLKLCREHGCWAGPGRQAGYRSRTDPSPGVVRTSNEGDQLNDATSLLGRNFAANLNLESSELAWLQRD